jgi:hypothetical protein
MPQLDFFLPMLKIGQFLVLELLSNSFVLLLMLFYLVDVNRPFGLLDFRKDQTGPLFLIFLELFLKLDIFLFEERYSLFVLLQKFLIVLLCLKRLVSLTLFMLPFLLKFPL